MIVVAFLSTLSFLIPLVRASSHPFQFRSSSGNSVETPIGVAYGTTPVNGVSRFAVKYASAQRWEDPIVATSWELPNGSLDPTQLPMPCPQISLYPSQYSEDCLSMLVYAPTINSCTNVPILLWIHGGSFISGSATSPGMDGTRLAKSASAIVVVVQYRLGALAFNSPDGRTNFAVQDIIASLKFLRQVLPSFQGDTSRITLAGQSSGANLIRALLATPSADSLFQSAILHSDPMDFGFLSLTVQSELQQYFNKLVNCSSTDRSCIDSLSLSAVLSASNTLFQTATNIDQSATSAEPMRPVHDGVLITTTLDSTSPFPPVSKPVILSTVVNEAGPTIYGSFTSSINNSTYEEIVHQVLEEPRATNLLESLYYRVPVLSGSQSADARVELERMGTDQVWRCPVSTFARSWTRHGGRAFVAEFTVGATYPDNDNVPFCAEAGVVCHEDDIEIVFGTVSNPTSAQSSLINEVQARYKSFLLTGDPNPIGSSFPRWLPATTGNFSVQNLGRSGTAAIGACNTNFWGTNNIPYDYQLFGI